MELSHLPFSLPSPLERILPLARGALWMKRDDLIHPIVSGNKWRKLKGFFADIDGTRPVLTFGGAYSNHLPAVACACALLQIPCVGVVRGEELSPASNARLAYCQRMGMRLYFVSRERYRALRAQDWLPEEALRRRWGLSAFERLPEGGAGAHVMAGCGELWSELRVQLKQAQLAPVQHIVLAAGTGATAAGLLSAMPEGSSAQVHVVSAVRGARRERAAVEAIAAQRGLTLRWEDECHFGGFGRGGPALTAARERFEAAHGIELDRSYNAKVWAYLERTLLEGAVVWINTGGIFEAP